MRHQKFAEVGNEEEILTAWGSLHGSTVGLESGKKLGRGEASKGFSLQRIHIAPQKSSPVISPSLPADGNEDHKISVLG